MRSSRRQPIRCAAHPAGELLLGRSHVAPIMLSSPAPANTRFPDAATGPPLHRHLKPGQRGCERPRDGLVAKLVIHMRL